MVCEGSGKSVPRVPWLMRGLVRMYHLYHGLWEFVTSIPLVPWFVGAWHECITCTMVCKRHGASVPLVPWLVSGRGTSVPLVPWFVGAKYEYTTCIMVSGDLVRVYHLCHGLWRPGTSVSLVSWCVRGLVRVYHLYHC